MSSSGTTRKAEAPSDRAPAARRERMIMVDKGLEENNHRKEKRT